MRLIAVSSKKTVLDVSSGLDNFDPPRRHGVLDYCRNRPNHMRGVRLKSWRRAVSKSWQTYAKVDHEAGRADIYLL